MKMLVNLPTSIQEDNKTKLFYKGLVVDNRDPLHLGCVKCKIEGLIESENIAQLPWCSPIFPPGLGGRSDLSSFSVPELHSTVLIMFPFEDVSQPYYFGRILDNTNATPSILFGDDYPDIYGFVDSTIQFLRVNKNENFIEFFRQLKDMVRLDADGNLQINLRGNVTINIDKDIYFNLKGNLKEHILGSVASKVDGVTKSDLGGSLKLQIGNGKVILIHESDTDIRYNGYKAERINNDTYSQKVGGFVDYSKPEGPRTGAICGDICTTTPVPNLSDLTTSLTVLNTKLDELKAMTDDLTKLRDNIKMQLAAQGVIFTGSDGD